MKAMHYEIASALKKQDVKVIKPECYTCELYVFWSHKQQRRIKRNDVLWKLNCPVSWSYENTNNIVTTTQSEKGFEHHNS